MNIRVVSAVVACLVGSRAGITQTVWAERTAGPPARSSLGYVGEGPSNFVMAYDSGRRRLVLLVGETSVPVSGGTWEWDGRRWTRCLPALGSPPPWGAAMAYDAARRRVVLFNGGTWEWDGLAWTRRLSATSPTASFMPAMAYDAARQRVVLFGGDDWNHQQPFAETWEWDGTAWSQRTPAVAPSRRLAHAMAYDAARGRVVLFGGLSHWEFGRVLGDTWEWDGMSWQQRPSAVKPMPRRSSSLAYDETRQRVVLFGGTLSPPPFAAPGNDETWEWDGTSWTQRAAPASPPGRLNHAMAFDAARSHVVLFGGDIGAYSARRPTADTWAWDGTTWTELLPSLDPQVREGHAMVYDPAGQRVLLVGGAEFSKYHKDLWEWNGQSWRELSESPHGFAAIAFDTQRRRLVLYSNGETWEWEGNAWAQFFPSSSPPSNPYAMAYDAARGRVVLFGFGGAAGAPAGTWLWDGTDWTQASPAASPPGRHLHALAYDDHRARVVLFGGELAGGTRAADTWEWDGSDWIERQPATRPTARSEHAMAYDTTRRRTVLFGGNSGAGLLSDAWEWDGSTWRPRPVIGSSPTLRAGSALAYDSARQRLVLFGGRHPGNSGWSGDTWVNGDLQAASTAVFGAACPASGMPPALRAFGSPAVGHASFAVDLYQAPAGAAYALAFSATSASTAVGGCTVYVGAPIVAVPGLANGLGFATTPLPIPTVSALAGLELFAQAWVVDAASGPLGLRLTQGLGLTIGE